MLKVGDKVKNMCDGTSGIVFQVVNGNSIIVDLDDGQRIDFHPSMLAPYPQVRPQPMQPQQPDEVNHPQHYADYYPIEVHDIIQIIMEGIERKGVELQPIEWADLFNELKYRLRAGFKDTSKIKVDIEKALWYNNKRRSNIKEVTDVKM